jgi:hypothetical protein
MKTLEESLSGTTANHRNNNTKKEWSSPTIETIGLDKTAGGFQVSNKENPAKRFPS